MKRVLNWREIEALATRLHAVARGRFVDRIVVPARPEFPDGFLKGEWIVRLAGGAIRFSVRPRAPYFEWVEGKGPKAAEQGTHSGFDRALQKWVGGGKLEAVEAVPRERAIVLWFSHEEGPRKQLGLALMLIPALPEAYLVERARDAAPPYTLLARSRTLRGEADTAEAASGKTWSPPDGAKSPTDLPLRAELVASLDAWSRALAVDLRLEALELRAQKLESALRARTKELKKGEADQAQTVAQASREPDWQRFGNLLIATLHAPPPLTPKNTRRLPDYESEDPAATIEAPCDPKLDAKQQVDAFYAKARRKEMRVAEASRRLADYAAKRAVAEADFAQAEALKARVARAIAKLSGTEAGAAAAGTANDPAAKLAGDARVSAAPAPGADRETSDLDREISALEEKLGFRGARGELRKESTAFGWSGKSFVSREGLPILVGRSRDENLELTTKFAKGNDLWLHVRGRPSAHVVVLLRDRKNAALETLLDAANVCLQYSGGENWGKTEVDYTFRKYVKRIKDSKEVSYTNNKTLVVELDRERMKRLFGEES